MPFHLRKPTSMMFNIVLMKVIETFTNVRKGKKQFANEFLAITSQKQ